MNDFTHCRELEPYRSLTCAMRMGAPGKFGKLDLVFELDGSGKSVMRHWERRAPLVVQQELYFDEEMPEMPCVYILSAGGPHVDGDRYENRFTVRKQACAFISTGAATKIAEMVHNFSGLNQTFVLEEHAYLEYLPEATIPCRNSRYVAETDIFIHPTATLFYSEIYTGGRKYYREGERFAYDLLSVCTRAHRPDGTPLFREKMVVAPQKKNVREIGVMDDYDIWADVMVLTPPADAAEIYARTQALLDRDRHLSVGISFLPNECGLILKVLGERVQSVKRVIREFGSAVRMQVKGKPFPEEFVWK